MSFHEQLSKFLGEFIRPEAEIRVEELLTTLLRQPVIRSLASAHPRIAAGFLQMLAGALPVSKSKTLGAVLQNFGVDLAKIVPREMVRIVEGKGGTRTGAGRTEGNGETASAILRMLDPKLETHLAAFTEWFFGLTPERQTAVERYVLSRKPEEVITFIGLSGELQEKILDRLPKNAKEEKPPLDEAAKELKKVPRSVVRATYSGRAQLHRWAEEVKRKNLARRG